MALQITLYCAMSSATKPAVTGLLVNHGTRPDPKPWRNEVALIEFTSYQCDVRRSVHRLGNAPLLGPGPHGGVVGTLQRLPPGKMSKGRDPSAGPGLATPLSNLTRLSSPSVLSRRREPGASTDADTEPRCG